MDRNALKICFFAALLWVLTAYLNIGFIAIDDYMHGIMLYLPAQYASFDNIVKVSEFRSPLPNLFLFSLSKTALKLGITDPVMQLKFVTTLVALLNSVGLLFAIKHFRLFSFSFADSASLQRLMALVGGFYFLSPLFLSRPLIESLSVSFLTLSSYFLLKAYKGEKAFLSVFVSVLFLGISCVFRYQVGLFGLAYVTLFFSPARKKALLGLALGGLLTFVLTGLPDFYLKGLFHASLKSYLAYNLEHSSIYGVTPFYSYFLLLIGMSLPPTFFSKFKNFEWQEYFKKLMPLVLGFFAFFVGHSAVPHKEERFMIPILLIFWILLVPLLFFLKTKQSWRLKYFLIVNALLILPASLNPPQINTIRLVKFMEVQHPSDTLYTVAEGNFIFPKAFSANQNLKVETKSLEELSQKTFSCSDLVAVRYDVKSALIEKIPHFNEIFVSKPGPLEQLVVWLNPKKNARRGPISVFQKTGCGH